MKSLFGVSVVLYFMKILSGSHNFWSNVILLSFFHILTFTVNSFRFSGERFQQLFFFQVVTIEQAWRIVVVGRMKDIVVLTCHGCLRTVSLAADDAVRFCFERIFISVSRIFDEMCSKPEIFLPARKASTHFLYCFFLNRGYLIL